MYSFPRLAVRPAPSHPIPVVVGGAAKPALERAARLADGMFLASDQDSGLAGASSFAGDLIQQIRVAVAELEKVGRDPAEFLWWYYVIMYPCDEPEAGWQELRGHVWQNAWKYTDMVNSAVRPGPPARSPAPDLEMLDTIRRRDVLIGPADHIADTLRSIRQSTGVPLRFVAKSCFPTFPFGHQLEVMNHLAEEVAPYV